MTETRKHFTSAYKAWKERPPAILAAGLALLAAVLLLDYLTGVDFAFAFFYLFPILLISWHLGERAGALFSVLGAFATYISDNILAHRSYSHPWVPYWDFAIYLLFFLVAGFLFARLGETKKRVEQLLQIKTDMLSLVSHEFGNNLAIMASALYLLKELDDSQPASEPQRQKYYGMLDRVCASLRMTSETFLDQVRMESGVFTLNIRTVEVRALAQNCVDVMSSLAEQKGVVLSAAFPELPIPVEADPDALALVFSNLVGNAIKYTPSGGAVTIRMSARDPKGPATISVEDTGIGISAPEQSAVFSGFYRTKEGRRAAKGTGIGLKVAKDLIERHGLSLKLESVAGKGSRFFFDIPISTRNLPQGQ